MTTETIDTATPAETTSEPQPDAQATTGASIAVRDSMSIAGINGRLRYARELANAGLLPQHYRRQPANVLYAVEYGLMLGVHPMAAINGVHVIDGKPTASPALMSALVRTAGHKLRIRVTGTVEAGDLQATATLIRSDDPDHPFEATWTLQDAERAELCTLSVDQQGRTVITARDRKGNRLPWEKYPKAMLKARSTGEVCREGAEEVLCGAHYTPEELGAMVNEEGEVIEGEVVGETNTPEPPKPLSPEAAEQVRKAIFGAFEQADPRAVLLNLWENTSRTRDVTKVLDHNGKEVTLGALILAAGAAHAEGGRLHDATPGPEAEQAAPAAEVAPETPQVDAEGIHEAEIVPDAEPTPEAVAEALGGTIEGDAAATNDDPDGTGHAHDEDEGGEPEPTPEEAAAAEAALAEAARPLVEGAQSKRDDVDLLREEIEVIAEILGVKVETLTTREVRSKKRPLGEWTRDDLLAFVGQYRQPAAERLRKQGREIAAQVYLGFAPTKVIDARTMLTE